MSQFLDESEVRSLDQRSSELAIKLPQQIRNAKTYAPGFSQTLKNIDPASIKAKCDLKKIQILRKSAFVFFSSLSIYGRSQQGASCWPGSRISAGSGGG